MIPIVLSMATIFHKIQGSTADYIASYLGKKYICSRSSIRNAERENQDSVYITINEASRILRAS